MMFGFCRCLMFVVFTDSSFRVLLFCTVWVFEGSGVLMFRVWFTFGFLGSRVAYCFVGLVVFAGRGCFGGILVCLR